MATPPIPSQTSNNSQAPTMNETSPLRTTTTLQPPVRPSPSQLADISDALARNETSPLFSTTLMRPSSLRKGNRKVTKLQRSMGRSRGPRASADEEFGQGSMRKTTASSGENSESTSAGKRALYHCNSCNKDITGRIRIKCVTCSDFDLCIECFSVGAEVYPHKSNHPYRVMDNLSFPLICPDWNADEEILLLEGLEMYGLENWAEVAEHVSTKSKAQCIDHNNSAYMTSPCFPLPDISHVAGKNKDELLAMSKGQSDGKTGFPPLGELTLDEDLEYSPSRAKNEEVAVGRSPSKSTPVSQPDKSVGGKKPISSGVEGPSLAELSGYNPKRHEFDPEYDPDAEQLLVDMEFKDTDTEEERELKFRVLHIYNRRLDERKRRKDFIIERNLLHPDPLEKDLSPEEREIYKRYKVFMRFHSKEAHDELIKTVIGEHRTRKRIQELEEARAAGCRTSAEAYRYIELKRRSEAEESVRRARLSTEVAPSGRRLQRTSRPQGEPDVISPRGGAGGYYTFQAGGSKAQPSTTAASASSTSSDVWDITGLPGSDLLSEYEKRLCGEMKMIPSQYLKMLEVMSIEILKGSLTRKSDAHRLFRVDPSKVDRVYDMLVSKGIAPPES